MVVEDAGPPLSLLQRIKSLKLKMVTAEALYHALIECSLGLLGEGERKGEKEMEKGVEEGGEGKKRRPKRKEGKE